jgi:hypothetical protein
MPRYWPPSDFDPGYIEDLPALPTAGPCVGPCNHRWRQAAEAYDKAMKKWLNRGRVGEEPRPPEIQPWDGQPVWCNKCAAIVRRALRELPDAYSALESMKYRSRTSAPDEERRGRADAAPSPSPGADHQDEILRTTCMWEDDLRRHLRHDAATDEFGDLHATLVQASEYLNRNFADMIRREECAKDFGDEVSKLYRNTVAMVKNKPGRKHLPCPCPSAGCGVKALIQEEGLAKRPWYVECVEYLGGCGRLYAEHDWDFFALLLTDGHIQPVEAAA